MKNQNYKKLFIYFSIFFLGLSFIHFYYNGLTFADDTSMNLKTITVNGEQRIFYVHIPTSYQKNKKKEGILSFNFKTNKYPAVIIFHGTVANANKIKNYTKFNDFADKNDIIAVYPEYTGNWDWDLKPAEKSKDIQYISEIIDYIIKNYDVDSKRIYQTGYSSGAEMSYLTACTLSDKIAAFAPVAGNIRKSYAEGCLLKKPVSIMLIHGTDDPYEKWNGDSKKEMYSVDETLNFWKEKNMCKSVNKETIFPHIDTNKTDTTAKLYENNSCKDGAEVSILKIEGGGHTWPNSPSSVRIETFLGKTNYDVSGNEIIWEFFKRHRLN